MLCAPGSTIKSAGVTLPVSLPSRKTLAPAGDPVTLTNPLFAARLTLTVARPPDATWILRICDAYPGLLTVTLYVPAGMGPMSCGDFHCPCKPSICITAPRGKAETSSCPWGGAAGAGCTLFRALLDLLLSRDQKCEAVARGSSAAGAAVADVSAGAATGVLNGAGVDALAVALGAALCDVSVSEVRSAGFLCSSMANAARITKTATTPATIIHLFEEPTDFRLVALVGGFGTLAFVVGEAGGVLLRAAALKASRLNEPVALALNDPVAFGLNDPVAFGLNEPERHWIV